MDKTQNGTHGNSPDTIFPSGSGENQVYTVGMIGLHKVVSTKLSRLGAGQGATLSAGNSVTRLLGEFSCRELYITLY